MNKEELNLIEELIRSYINLGKAETKEVRCDITKDIQEIREELLKIKR